MNSYKFLILSSWEKYCPVGISDQSSSLTFLTRNNSWDKDASLEHDI